MSDTASTAETGIETVKIDGFVKTVLVVIAIILGIMGASHFATKAKSQEPHKTCGMTKGTPCYIIKL